MGDHLTLTHRIEQQWDAYETSHKCVANKENTHLQIRMCI